jgi:tetratricopeptide (TPR) repeat protein
LTNTHRKLLGAIALVLLCLIVFGNTLGHEFVYDDMKVIVENPRIDDFAGSLPHFFDRSYFQISGGEASYRPVPTFSYYLLYLMFGSDPLGYHLFSLLLHAANAVLVFLLFEALPIRQTAALTGAALFAVHPVVTEAVNCISFNEDLLVTFFYLTSLLAVIHSEQKAGAPGLRLEWIAWVAFAVALFSKEMALTLPLIAYLQNVVFKFLPGGHSIFRSLFESLRLRLRLYLGYLVLVAGYLYIRFFLMAGATDAAIDGVPLLERLVFIPYQILGYLKLTVFPFDLSAEYVHAYPQRFFAPVHLAALFLVAAMVACAWLARKKLAAVTFGIGWFLICLTPVLNLYELVNPMAERYLYLPVIGAMMTIVSGIWAAGSAHATARFKWVRPVMPVLLICLLTVWAAFSFHRNRVWQNNYTLFSATAKKVPDSPRVRGGLGLAYQQMNRLPEAAREFERAIELNPGLVDAHFSLAYVYEKSGRTEAAIAAYERVARLDPGFRDVYYNLAGLYVKEGRLEAARQAYIQHVERRPDDIEARNNLGVVYAMLGRLTEAEVQWRRVLTLSPDNQSARDNIAKLEAVKSGGQAE